MNEKTKNKKEFGDFQTPDYLAEEVCQKLIELGIVADNIIEPTCGVGGFVLSAAKSYQNSKIYGFEINGDYIQVLSSRLEQHHRANAKIVQADFFSNDWKGIISKISGSILVLGNLPWVTNSTQGSLGGGNLPQKNNFQNFKGLDAVTGKANFDISEWMLLEIMSWLEDRPGAIAMLVKTAVARKIISHAEKKCAPLATARIFKINAKTAFDAAVEACLLVLEFDTNKPRNFDYSVYESLDSTKHITIGHRDGLIVSNLDNYQKHSHLIGSSSVKWRSGVKHDLSSVMELTSEGEKFVNGLGEEVDIESDLLFPLLKGSDVSGKKEWRRKYALVTQSFVGEDTSYIKEKFPKTWNYLVSHSEKLDARGSVIYKKNPRFSIFGVGDYTFKPWKIAICGLYKSLNFRLIGPINNKATVFDDTVYFISFDTEKDAKSALCYLQKEEVRALLDSLIFWDDKRPIKTSVLNVLRWENENPQHTMDFS
ncbi:class I SAM-dependent methyltransferase [Comamonas aquatica]|uniref:class I SAM-dependent methyltransferase n=1 Tax=Comamonas aquatica TaxID=225991 RepID=UPI00244ACB36|nr:class I SAM-dependent methyltransferase [Comamonas aquatica]MDH1766563.1 class I SAM-dependent methyltransferase [Comamonas aquatica]